MKYLTGGGLRIDYLITHDGQAHVGLPGGNAVYAAVGAAVWSDEVGVWGRIGANYPPTWAERLAAAGLQTAGLVRIPGEQDHRTFFAYLPDGTRVDTEPAAHFARIGQPFPPTLRDYVHSTPGQDEPDRYEPLALRPGDWRPEAFAGATAVHLSPLSLASHRRLPPFLRRQGVRQITVDPGERYMIPTRERYLRHMLPHVDAFLPSDMEIRSLFGDDADLEAAAATLCRWGAPLVIIKRGSQGVLLQTGTDGRPLSLPAYHHPGDPRVTDVTGAGDAFCGGFMVGLAQTANPAQAARYGLVSASLVVEGYGALYALERRGERNDRLQSLHL